jgi:Lon protease-like protein
MVDAALASHRLIGMIQPAAMFGPNAPLEDDRPALSRVGCAGRITEFAESGDGRLLITLTAGVGGQSREEVVVAVHGGISCG